MKKENLINLILGLLLLAGMLFTLFFGGEKSMHGVEPEFWLNLQVRYNMKIARSKVGKKIEKEVKVRHSQIEAHNLTTV